MKNQIGISVFIAVLLAILVGGFIYANFMSPEAQKTRIEQQQIETLQKAHEQKIANDPYKATGVVTIIVGRYNTYTESWCSSQGLGGLDWNECYKRSCNSTCFDYCKENGFQSIEELSTPTDYAPSIKCKCACKENEKQ